jgi:hypothetical protein
VSALFSALVARVGMPALAGFAAGFVFAWWAAAALDAVDDRMVASRATRAARADCVAADTLAFERARREQAEKLASVRADKLAEIGLAKVHDEFALRELAKAKAAADARAAGLESELGEILKRPGIPAVGDDLARRLRQR